VEALADSEKAVELDSSYSKAFYRKGQSLDKLKRVGSSEYYYRKVEHSYCRHRQFKLLSFSRLGSFLLVYVTCDDRGACFRACFLPFYHLVVPVMIKSSCVLFSSFSLWLLLVLRSRRGLQRRRCARANQQDLCHSSHQSAGSSRRAGPRAAAFEGGREAVQARARSGAPGLGKAGGEGQGRERGEQAKVHGERNARLQSDGGRSEGNRSACLQVACICQTQESSL